MQKKTHASVFIFLVITVHAIECISCEYLDFTATGPSTVTDAAKNFTSQKNGSEECFVSSPLELMCFIINQLNLHTCECVATVYSVTLL